MGCARMATILVVDDRQSNRQFLSTLLGYCGHRLFEAANGAEALEQVRAERPELVITLPVGAEIRRVGRMPPATLLPTQVTATDAMDSRP